MVQGPNPGNLPDIGRVFIAKIHGEATQKSAIGPSQRVCSQEDPTEDTFNSRTQNPHPTSLITVGLYWDNGKENGSYRDLKHYIVSFKEMGAS